jgi:hypothetical protein
MELAISKIMATPDLIAPARTRSLPTPCGNRPSRPPAIRVSKAVEFWPFSAFARAAWLNPLHWRITPAQLCAWRWILKKILEALLLLQQKEKQLTLCSKSCQTSCNIAFREALELAHNICSAFNERLRNFIDKISALELSAKSLEFGSFQVRKYYFIGHLQEAMMHDCYTRPLPAIRRIG